MLPIKNRIPKCDFDTVLKNAKRTSFPLFICKWNKGRTTHPRFGIVVSGSICKKAVERNRKRRQLYEAIRKNCSQHPPFYDILLYAKKPLSTASFQTIEKDIISLLHKLPRS